METLLRRYRPDADLGRLLDAILARVDWETLPACAPACDLGMTGLIEARSQDIKRATAERAHLARYPLSRDVLELIEHQLAPGLRRLVGLSATDRLMLSGNCLYGTGGFMGWHSNEDQQGLRVYCIYSEESGKNFFRYQDPYTGKIVTDAEKAGWGIRTFELNSKRPLWHCVYAGCRRLSVGFRYGGAATRLVNVV
ncbi:MAG: hypothetical protein LC731_04120, partial [Acidobacteria bacterium]|nr:hypothetical protein [Acidobacteriota bacterium]